MTTRKVWAGVVLACVLPALAAAQQTAGRNEASSWQFAVSGDSRNCGDVVMPAIAAGAARNQADFYWHLGDFRAIYDFDDDYQQEAALAAVKPLIIDYHNRAWDDFIQNQLMPFGNIPVFLGIGNHETASPKTRADYLSQFSDWLNTPELKAQRLKDNPADHRLKTYYHWTRKGVDFINLDNASNDQFDAAQMGWVSGVIARDMADAAIQTVVVGMHEALPESISFGHSMSEYPQGEQSGQALYQQLLKLQNEGHKKVYVLASHSHFFMDGIFNTEFWKTHGGVLPGWIVGTAGAVRYPLPPAAKDANASAQHVYGYLLARAHGDGTIKFEFQELKEGDVPAATTTKFTQAFVHRCFEENPKQ